MMSNEQMIIIKMLSDHLHNRTTKVENIDIDWTIVLRYAKIHQISGIIYVQSKKYMPIEVEEKLHKAYLSTIYKQKNREYNLTSLKALFDEESIPFFIVKGQSIAKYYPVPELRTMCDTDIVVHSEDREKCHSVLMTNGFNCLSKINDREWQYYKNNAEYELHDRLVYDESINEKEQVRILNDCWPYVNDGKLEWSFHLLFLIFHLRKHFMNSGVGFRQFMDLTVIAQNNEIDWEWLTTKLIETSMLKFAKRCFGLIGLWFGFQFPLTEDIDNEFCESALQKVFEDGVFGFDNTDNTSVYIVNQIRKEKNPSISMLRLAIKRIFPSYKTLEKDDEYSVILKNRLLLPVVWGYRFVKLMVQKKKNSSSLARNIFVDKGDFEKRIEMYEKWGL